MANHLIPTPRRKSRILMLASAVVLAGSFMAAQSAEAPQFNKDISVDEIMEAIVMPTADALWKAVQVDVTAKGEVSTAPKNDEEWLALRHQAVTLAAVTNLLMIPTLNVSKTPTSTAHGEGELSKVDMEKVHKSKMAAFAAFAQVLHATAMHAIQVIDKRDTMGLSDVGGDIDAACESCHLVFWYPNQGSPDSKK